MQTPQVSDPQEYILTSAKPFNLFMAGAGSGKTFTMGLLSGDFIKNQPHMIGFIGANTYDQLNKSTLKRIFEEWRKYFGWLSDVNYVVDKRPPKHFESQNIKLKSYNNTISFDNGTLLFTASLDNYRAIDGQEFGWALLDETKDTAQEAIDEVIVWRLRQPGMWIDEKGQIVNTPSNKGYNPLYIFTSPAKEQWLNEMFGLENHYDEIDKHIYSKTDFFKVEDHNKCVVISSSFHNEVNLPSGFIQSRIEMYRGNKNLIDTYVYGSPIAKVGGEFYNQFVRSVHVKKLQVDENSYFHLSCDQNVHPYYTMLVMQIAMVDGRWKVRILREYCLSNPDNNMESVCNAFKNEFGDICRGIFYYGDVSGLIKSTIRKTGEHHYDVLEEILKRYIGSNSNRLIKSNPPIIQRRDFMNGLFAGAFPIDIEIDESCKNTIADFEYVKEDAEGKKLKKIVTDKNTGISYQKLGHTSDAAEYCICSAFQEDFNKFKNARR